MIGDVSVVCSVCETSYHSWWYPLLLVLMLVLDGAGIHHDPKFQILFQRSEFLIATCKKKKTDRLSGCVSGCSDNLLVLVCKNCLGFSVGYQRAPGWF